MKRLWNTGRPHLTAVVLFVVLLSCSALSSQDTAIDHFPDAVLKVGGKIPELSGADQFGKPQNFDSLKGRNGLVLLFFRSVDW